MEHDETRLKRLKYRAWHRGFREADLILGPFADTHGPNLPPDQLAAFEALLDEADPDIYAWIVETADTPPQHDNEIMRLLKQFRFEAFAARGGGPHGG
ncbi:MAG: succinate dehydrogenase assembly factor 2 [Phenylobacterium sp.]|nr:succinate dehydrogenase assembly factor 2 [Phenylobacterium sp.]MDP3658710.1 succinate dehydrogenase assembly factor 2 [Phenylobacterium sp.]